MTDDLRWAVRYAFLEDQWRDRARVIVDAGLEASLRGAASRPARDDDPIDELVDGLVPRVPGARTWVGVADEATARELAQTRPGTGFLPRNAVADVVAHRDWVVALVELQALTDGAPGGTRLREQLAARAEDGRTVIVAAPAEPGSTGDDSEDRGYAALAELLEEELGGGRIYGVYRPPMASVVDFGGDEDDEDDEVPLAFDNTLGSQAPAFVEYLGVVGPEAPLPSGVTLVELPPQAVAFPSAGEGAGLRGQLVQAQRQAELAAIDRQTLVESLDRLESVNANLEQQVAELRDRLTREITQSAPDANEASDRLQATLADNQALRWSVQQLERQVADLRARPVEALEAEVAELRARLAAAERSDEPEALEPDEDDEPEGEAPDPDDAELDDDDDDLELIDDADEAGPLSLLVLDDDDGLEATELVVMVSDADDRAQRIREGAALRQLDRLIERVERGGIGALQLRQALVSLRQRLR